MYILLAYLLLTLRAMGQSGMIDSTNMITLRIDPLSARGASVSQVFEEVNFIPLESTKESLFGSINQLKVVEGNFVIFDTDTKAILIFSKTGKFINKVVANKAEKGLTSFSGFEVVEEANKTLVIISSNDYYFYYDLSGKFVKKTTREEYRLRPVKLSEFKGYGYRRNYTKDDIWYDVIFTKDDQMVSSYFPVPMNRLLSDIGSTVYAVNQEDVSRNYFFTRKYSYDIYRLAPPKVELAYKIIFPAMYSLPTDFADNPDYIGTIKRRAFFDQNRELIYGLGNVHQSGDNLLFKIGVREGDHSRKNMLLYNLKRNELISINHIEPDMKSFYLPVVNAGYEFYSRGFIANDNQYLYTTYSSLSFHQFRALSKEKVTKLNQVLTTYFANEDKTSNPIIIQLKLKKD